MKPFLTMAILPDTERASRFTALSLGVRNIQAVREEFTLLRSMVAAVCGIAPDQLTQDHVALAHRKLHALLESQAALTRVVAAYDEDGKIDDIVVAARHLVPHDDA